MYIFNSLSEYLKAQICVNIARKNAWSVYIIELRLQNFVYNGLKCIFVRPGRLMNFIQYLKKYYENLSKIK